jgi:RNA polymerase sigma-70 factor (ECF subfamily)
VANRPQSQVDDPREYSNRQEWLGHLYEQYVDRIYAYLLYRTGNAPDAEDLTQRVFSQALSASDGYDPTAGSAGGWLFRIAHNLLANYHRTRARRPSAPLEAAAGAPDPALVFEGIEAQEDARAVRRAMARLSPERQHLILLKYTVGLSNAEIGEALGKSEGAVKSLLRRTLGALRRELDADHAEA